MGDSLSHLDDLLKTSNNIVFQYSLPNMQTAPHLSLGMHI